MNKNTYETKDRYRLALTSAYNNMFNISALSSLFMNNIYNLLSLKSNNKNNLYLTNESMKLDSLLENIYQQIVSCYKEDLFSNFGTSFSFSYHLFKLILFISNNNINNKNNNLQSLFSNIEKELLLHRKVVSLLYFSGQWEIGIQVNNNYKKLIWYN